MADSGERPHRCEGCGDRFQRLDVLRRHVAQFCAASPRSSDEANRGAAPKSLRTNLACDLCHSKKLRCDASVPCQQCISRQVSCTYNRDSQRPHRRHPSRLRRTHAGIVDATTGTCRNVGSSDMGAVTDQQVAVWEEHADLDAEPRLQPAHVDSDLRKGRLANDIGMIQQDLHHHRTASDFQDTDAWQAELFPSFPGSFLEVSDMQFGSLVFADIKVVFIEECCCRC